MSVKVKIKGITISFSSKNKESKQDHPLEGLLDGTMSFINMILKDILSSSEPEHEDDIILDKTSEKANPIEEIKKPKGRRKTEKPIPNA
jgi:hypothetical protein